MSSYFFDRNIPVLLVRLIDVYERQNTVVYLDDRFDQRTTDIDWMSALRDDEESPVVICGDMRIMRNAAEAQVLRSTELTFVFLKPGWINLRWEELAWKFLKAWPLIVEQTSRARAPTIFELTAKSKVERKCLTREL